MSRYTFFRKIRKKLNYINNKDEFKEFRNSLSNFYLLTQTVF